MIKIIAFVLFLAALLAKLELQIEGKKDGWALKLPCWRINNRFTQLILGKEITGYHAWLLTTFLVIFHSPYLFIPFTLKTEIILLGLFSWFWIAEDWFWFIENSLYGVRNFKPGRIFWHKRWIWFLPVSYFWGIIIGTGLLIIGGILK